MYLNYYECHECNHRWVDLYESCPDDDCPRCGTRHVRVHHSLDVPEWDAAALTSEHPHARVLVHVKGGRVENVMADRQVKAAVLDADIQTSSHAVDYVLVEYQEAAVQVDQTKVAYVFSLVDKMQGGDTGIVCTFVSVWDGVAFRSPALLHEDGSIEITECRYDVDGVEVLEREYLEMPNGSEFPVCSSCHEHVATDGTDECDKCRK